MLWSWLNMIAIDHDIIDLAAFKYPSCMATRSENTKESHIIGLHMGLFHFVKCLQCIFCISIFRECNYHRIPRNNIIFSIHFCKNLN
ncbi:hypothetical protein RHGRI_028970 [Rhododendron griersonianum]|uniref:Uncharacterized protein n=1 Tax=Rhododendron griersonianum TaxID=479676 RepID=A0AAV6IHR9_9ERIC|nr:hypothetical protein RHGRI_028970 [Rhododendron griersonianum]